MVRVSLFGIALALVLALSPAQARTFAEMFPKDAGTLSEEGRALFGKMDFRQGKVTLPGAIATLDVGPKYYFLGPGDSATILTRIWANPPGMRVLGMVMPAALPPDDPDAWGIVLSYDDIGHVSDDDAAHTDFSALLRDMQKAVEKHNDERKKQGYAAMHLVGWAEPPHYDLASRKLYWAKDIRFEDSDFDTLNFNIRALGREGVLQMNFVARMDQLPVVKAAVPDALSMVNFTEGNRYEDFIPSVDKMAAVGIGTLIAGKLAAKAGFLVVALAFLKKFFVLLLLPLVWLKGLIFGRRES